MFVISNLVVFETGGVQNLGWACERKTMSMEVLIHNAIKIFSAAHLR